MTKMSLLLSHYLLITTYLHPSIQTHYKGPADSRNFFLYHEVRQHFQTKMQSLADVGNGIAGLSKSTRLIGTVLHCYIKWDLSYPTSTKLSISIERKKNKDTKNSFSFYNKIVEDVVTFIKFESFITFLGVGECVTTVA